MTIDKAINLRIDMWVSRGYTRKAAKARVQQELAASGGGASDPQRKEPS